MTGDCALCPAVGVELASCYKETDLGAQLCTCCQIKVFNLLCKSLCPPEHVDIALAFARFMPDGARPRQRRLNARAAAPRRVTRAWQPSDWCAHSLPPEN